MSELDTFIETCTNGVHPSTVAAIIEIVTARDPFIFSVLPADGKQYRAAVSDAQTVIEKGKEVIMEGGEVSVGLMQVSSHYWLEYDVTVADMMHPCTNIEVGSSLFAETYKHFFDLTGDEREAMRAAFDTYIQGNIYESGGYSVTKLFERKSQGESPVERTSQRESPVDRSNWSAEMRVASFDELLKEESDNENGVQ